MFPGSGRAPLSMMRLCPGNGGWVSNLLDVPLGV